MGSTTPVLRRIAVGAVQLFGANSTISLLGLINTIFFTHYLPVDEYGIALTVLTAISLFAGWGGIGTEVFLTSDIARELGEGRDRVATRLLRQYAIVRIVTTGLMSVAVILGWGYIASRINLSSPYLMIGIILTLVAQSLYSINQLVFSTQQRFDLISISMVTQAIIRTILVLPLPFITWHTTTFIVLIYGISTLAAGIILLPTSFKQITKKFPDSGDGLTLASALRKHGKWAVFLDIIKQIVDSSPNLILASIVGMEAVAIYNVATRFVALLEMPISVFDQVLGPVLANKLSSAQELAPRITKYALALAIVICIAGAISAKWLIQLLFSKTYDQSILIALICIPATISVALRSGQRPILYASRRQDLMLVSYILTIGAELVFDILYAWLWGLVGFTIARVSFTFIVFFVRQRLLWHIGKGFKIIELLRIDAFDRLVFREILMILRRKLRIA